MSIFTHLPVNRSRPLSMYVDMAIGTIDQYGNPFELVEVRWRNTDLHRGTENMKCQGFQDAEIRRNRRGDLVVTYRNSGTLWFNRKNGVGPYTAQMPKTPRNMKRLSSMYKNNLVVIPNRFHDAELKALYEEKEKNMDEGARKFNEQMNRGMHTRQAEIPMQPIEVINNNAPVDELAREREALYIEKKKMLEKQEELEKKEEELLGVANQARTGYKEEYLRSLPFPDLKRLAKREGVTTRPTSKTDEIIADILDKQPKEAITG